MIRLLSTCLESNSTILISVDFKLELNSNYLHKWMKFNNPFTDVVKSLCNKSSLRFSFQLLPRRLFNTNIYDGVAFCISSAMI